ncbi:hypothetical protein [Parabacteroides sp. PF5-9]|uniref:hypothetical protein n=1 Tax=Parabacteroides sp. PF5-9 TaxID=1742404 RepID=UPI002475552D|nr:hypothetical protein [Parabacteroides sp. PF5-9]MDH6358951.1 hypothetical protein [Parabacteroides sp. PF5-9]
MNLDKIVIRLEFKGIGWTYPYIIDWSFPILPQVGDDFFSLGEFLSPEQFRDIVAEAEFPVEYRDDALKCRDRESIINFLENFTMKVDFIEWNRKNGLTYPIVYIKHVWYGERD